MNPIHFARPDVSQAEIDAVVEVLESGWLTSGEKARLFEEQFARAVGARHAIAVNSCTAALHLSLEAVGVGPGDEVILPSMTFAATAAVVHHLGGRPVLVDVLAADHMLDPDDVEHAITEHTKAIITVAFAGQSPQMSPLLEIGQRHRLAVITDAAHAFPARYRDRMVGNLGDITCFSFYATKTLTTGEGGMVTTNRDDCARRIRMMSLHGLSKDTFRRQGGDNHWYYEIIAPGWKYNLSDIAAAMGLAQLSRSMQMLQARQAIAKRYRIAFAREDYLEFPEVRPECDHAWHLFVVRLRPGVLSIDRDRVIKELHLRGVGASVHFIPLHIHPYYRDTYGYRPQDFPIALDLYQRSFSLPIYSAMSDSDVDRVIDAVLTLGAEYRH